MAQLAPAYRHTPCHRDQHSIQARASCLSDQYEKESTSGSENESGWEIHPNYKESRSQLVRGTVMVKVCRLNHVNRSCWHAKRNGEADTHSGKILGPRSSWHKRRIRDLHVSGAGICLPTCPLCPGDSPFGIATTLAHSFRVTPSTFPSASFVTFDVGGQCFAKDVVSRNYLHRRVRIVSFVFSFLVVVVAVRGESTCPGRQIGSLR